jgi:hypothetical protein
MLALYRLARDAGHTIISSLSFVIFNRPLPYHSAEKQRKIDSYLARIAAPEDENLADVREDPDKRPMGLLRKLGLGVIGLIVVTMIVVFVLL